MSTSELDFPPGSDSADSPHDQGLVNGAAVALSSKGEYQNGRVVCELCGEGISFRDEETGAFTVKQWDAHRMKW